MSDTALEAVIHEHCRELKLAAFVREYPALCRRARDGARPYEEFLRELLEAEVTSRRQSTARRLLREARFPDVKTLDQVDWMALKGVSKPKILELASCQFIACAEAVIIAGPIGTGKTMLAIGLGVEATRRRYRVLFTRAADLVQSLLEARDERTLTRLQQRYEKVGLLIVDELGFVPFERAGGELLFNLLAQRYERRATIITTNLAFGEWVKVFSDEKLTTALLDRLTHHSHVLTTRGESYRSHKPVDHNGRPPPANQENTAPAAKTGGGRK
jgi:DNA replication protein DnaC